MSSTQASVCCFWQRLVIARLKKRPKFGNVAPFLNRSNRLLTIQLAAFIRRLVCPRG
jgi:hypothetical protein